MPPKLPCIIWQLCTDVNRLRLLDTLEMVVWIYDTLDNDVEIFEGELLVVH